MTGFGDEKIAVEMMKLGAQDYLVKDQNFLEILNENKVLAQKVIIQWEVMMYLNQY